MAMSTPGEVEHPEDLDADHTTTQNPAGDDGVAEENIIAEGDAAYPPAKISKMQSNSPTELHEAPDEQEGENVLHQTEEEKEFEYWNDVHDGDVIIKCGETSWRAHSRIICHLSEFFAAKLQYDPTVPNPHTAVHPAVVEFDSPFVASRVFSCVHYIYYGYLPSAVMVVENDDEPLNHTDRPYRLKLVYDIIDDSPAKMMYMSLEVAIGVCLDRFYCHEHHRCFMDLGFHFLRLLSRMRTHRIEPDHEWIDVQRRDEIRAAVELAHAQDRHAGVEREGTRAKPNMIERALGRMLEQFHWYDLSRQREQPRRDADDPNVRYLPDPELDAMDEASRAPSPGEDEDPEWYARHKEKILPDLEYVESKDIDKVPVFIPLAPGFALKTVGRTASGSVTMYDMDDGI
ncbi:hypothetical protein F4810DRAFT_706385 [Camillea tinctor]|nr:hypothetical protein F4810DRAFT_706385 [Camillea tinctor]